jgi:hypothetical protein
MNRRGPVLILLFIVLVGCAAQVTALRRGGPISPRDGIFVEIRRASEQSDSANLAPVFRAALMEAGFSVAMTRSEAVYLLSGTYGVQWDLLHYKLNFGHFRITEIKTGKIVMMLESGDTGVASAQTGVHKMVEAMVRENR